MGGNDGITAALTAIVRPFVGRTGGLISALRAIQAARGFLPPETEEAAAAAFNLTRAEVKGVISFYSDFARAPKGGTVIRLCAAEACQAQGARALAANHAALREVAARYLVPARGRAGAVCGAGAEAELAAGGLAFGKL